jgi:hypothetical protein
MKLLSDTTLVDFWAAKNAPVGAITTGNLNLCLENGAS